MKISFSYCIKSVVWEPDLEEAETIFTVFQTHFFWIKAEQCPAESRRLGLLKGLQLRYLADGLRRVGSDRHTATVTGISLVPVFIRLVFGGDTVPRHEDQLSWRIASSIGSHWRSRSELRNTQKSHVSHCMSSEMVNLIWLKIKKSVSFVFLG